MKITWFDSEDDDGRINSKGDRLAINKWVKDNEEDLRHISHLSYENEMEASKVIAGDQEIDKGGRITLNTLELRFIRDLVLILRTVEVQDPGSFTIKRTATQLGYLELPDHGKDCDCLAATKKEIK